MAALLATYAAVPAWLELSVWKGLIQIPANFHALLGLVLGMLLVFRTNTAYDRWWEGASCGGNWSTSAATCRSRSKAACRPPRATNASCSAGSAPLPWP